MEDLNNNKYRDLFDLLRSGIVILEARNGGKEFVFVDINQAAESMDKLEKKEVLGKTVQEVFPGAQKFGIIDSFRRVWETGQPELHPVALYEEGQKKVWRESYIYKINNGQIVSIYDDLSENKKTEKRVEENLRMYDMIAEYSTDVIWALTLDFKFKYVSKAAIDALGYQPKELIGKSITEIIEPDFLRTAQRMLEEDRFRIEMHDYAPRRMELRLMKKDRDYVWAEITSKLIMDEKNNPVDIIGTMHNISSRKKTLKELEEREQEYRDIFEASMDAFIIFDRAGFIKGANAAACELYGYKKEELLALSGKVIVHPDHHDVFEEFINKTSAGESFDAESVDIRKDRTKIDVEVRGRLFNYKGKPHCLAVIRDISQRKKIERAQRMTNLGELSANVAHEVNNPLQVVLGRVELLLMKEPNKEELKASLNTIREQCSRARDIIRQMQIVSKPSVGDFKVIDIHESIENVFKLLEHQLALQNIEVKRKYQKEPVLVKVDEKKINQVIINLIRNSANAMDKKGTITIVTHLRDDQAIVEFRDDGKGIAEGDIAKVMDPFFTTRKEGTGLGLSICYSIIKAHNGELKVTNNFIGKGVCATISLPIAGI